MDSPNKMCHVHAFETAELKDDEENRISCRARDLERFLRTVFFVKFRKAHLCILPACLMNKVNKIILQQYTINYEFREI